MNKIWLFMMMFSSIVLLITDPSKLLIAMSTASSDVVKLCIDLVAIYTIWLGLLEILEQSGLGEKLAKLLKPIIKKLYKTEDAEVEKMLAINMSANMLGLGNAATPMGIKAMEKLDDKSGTITPAMIMLIIVNATSIQLLPTTVIGLRAAAGSKTPADIILPTLLVTIFTTILGISLVLLIEHVRKWKKKA